MMLHYLLLWKIGSLLITDKSQHLQNVQPLPAVLITATFREKSLPAPPNPRPPPVAWPEDVAGMPKEIPVVEAALNANPPVCWAVAAVVVGVPNWKPLLGLVTKVNPPVWEAGVEPNVRPPVLPGVTPKVRPPVVPAFVADGVVVEPKWNPRQTKTKGNRILIMFSWWSRRAGQRRIQDMLTLLCSIHIFLEGPNFSCSARHNSVKE